MDDLHPTKKLIFDAITALLNEQGMSAVTFSAISARSYLQRASIAYHFKGRQDMLNQYYSYFLAITHADPVPLPLSSPADESDLVGSFCRLIDGLFGGYDDETEQPAAGAIGAHMLISSLHDEGARNLVQHNIARANTQLLQAFAPYVEAGIIEESHIPLAMADMAVYSATESFIDVFNFDIKDYGLALKATIERVKRTLLKPGLYPQNKPE